MQTDHAQSLRIQLLFLFLVIFTDTDINFFLGWNTMDHLSALKYSALFSGDGLKGAVRIFLAGCNDPFLKWKMIQ